MAARANLRALMGQGPNAPTATPFSALHPLCQKWFEQNLGQPTSVQERAWPVIARGASTLLVAPTGSGKTLAAFYCSLDRLLFQAPPSDRGCRVLYVSPLKALAADVEKNLQYPLAGIFALAERTCRPINPVSVAIRSGDTPAGERERMRRAPPDILITTPESLYLMLTSRAREMFRSLQTIIIDEIHALVPNKRGTHLFLSLERLEALAAAPLQRIGLSATQRPLQEVAELLAGCEVFGGSSRPRPVTIIDAHDRKPLAVTVEVPTRDMVTFSDVPQPEEGTSGASSDGTVRTIWPALFSRLLSRIQQHRSTIVFVSSRMAAERVAGGLNELAAKQIAYAHHGSLAPDARRLIEQELKEGQIPAIVATASLELGIDMGQVDLVMQLGAPPSVASGLQRIGRACHQVGGVPRGVVLPQRRGDLLPSAACVEAMLEGEIEPVRYLRNPLDVLAQQVVAIVSSDSPRADVLFDTVRRAAPYAQLSRALFDSVLDMLSGRYPSDDFSELRPRITWDRNTGQLTPRKGASLLAISNGGAIADRGLYGVFLSDGAGESGRRVGELDEEMVFESRVGDVIVLGASSWRIDAITLDRVLVTPAPGEPGRMPFWRGEGTGRSLDFGLRVGALCRRLVERDRAEARQLLRNSACMDENAVSNLLSYLQCQEVDSDVPTDRCIVLERFVDEVGDFRTCLLSPLGSRVHAPWAIAVRARLLDERGVEADITWSDEGIVFRLAQGDAPPPLSDFLLAPDQVEQLVASRLCESSLFAARFRENAGRALLLPKRRPGGRTPLWASRRKAASLLSVVAKFQDFPIVLETFRECLQDYFDVPGLKQILSDIESKKIQVVARELPRPSAFASGLLFNFMARFLYDADTPLAERRAQALALDPVALSNLLGEDALGDLLDDEVIDEVERSLRRLEWALEGPDDVHDLLLFLGPLFRSELLARGCSAETLTALCESGRLLQAQGASGPLLFAVEDAVRVRDGLALSLPDGIPDVFLQPVADPLGDLMLRHFRSSGPQVLAQVAARFGLTEATLVSVLRRLESDQKLVSGSFRSGLPLAQWCHVEVLQRIKRACQKRLRAQVEAVDDAAACRFSLDWHQIARRPLPSLDGAAPLAAQLFRSLGSLRAGLGQPRAHPDALLDVIELLQGLPVSVQALGQDILPARVAGFEPSDLDALCVAGSVVWQGVKAPHQGDAHIALYLSSELSLLGCESEALRGEEYDQIRRLLAERGSLFFREIASLRGGFGPEVLARLWDLVWNGEVSNDSLVPLRSLLAQGGRAGRRRPSASRGGGRSYSPGSEGRFWLVRPDELDTPTSNEQRTRRGLQLLARHGIVSQPALGVESPGLSFSQLLPLYRTLEERGHVRRGYFVRGRGARQFAKPEAVARLRAAATTNSRSVACLSAVDPANIYGSGAAWPEKWAGRARRTHDAHVVLAGGHLLGYLAKGRQELLTCLPEAAQARQQSFAELLFGLIQLLLASETAPLGSALPRICLARIDQMVASEIPEVEQWLRAGFVREGSRLTLRLGALAGA